MWRAHHLLLLTYSYINKMEWKRGFWRESGWVLNNNKATFKFYSILDCHFTYAHTPKHIRTSCRRCQPTWWFFRVLHCFFRLIKAFLLSTQYVRVMVSPFFSVGYLLYSRTLSFCLCIYLSPYPNWLFGNFHKWQTFPILLHAKNVTDLPRKYMYTT